MRKSVIVSVMIIFLVVGTFPNTMLNINALATNTEPPPGTSPAITHIVGEGWVKIEPKGEPPYYIYKGHIDTWGPLDLGPGDKVTPGPGMEVSIIGISTSTYKLWGTKVYGGDTGKTCLEIDWNKAMGDWTLKDATPLEDGHVESDHVAEVILLIIHFLIHVGIHALCGFHKYLNTTDGFKVFAYNNTMSVTTSDMNTNETIDVQTIHGDLWFDEHGTAWSFGQEITIYEDGTISEPTDKLLDTIGMAFAPYGSDSTGMPKAHSLKDEIYVSAYISLLKNDTDVSTYLMPSDVPLPDYSPKEAIASNTARTNNWGDMPPTYLWKPTESDDIGVYNIWIDRDNSGSYTEGDMINALPVLAPVVGGIWVPIDKLALLAPYVGLASTIVVATVATAICVRSVKCRKKK